MTELVRKMSAIKAEDIVHVLRDGVALLHGGRCRNGRAVIVFPSREQPVNPDHLRNVLLYLFTVTEDLARENGILVVIDMRGKQTWTNVRPILKALNSIETTNVSQVYIIKPEKFWEKQKTTMSLGTWRFEVEMVSFENLIKSIDSSQLPKTVGGTHPYDHDEWLEIRLELEKWIWNITEVMGNLEAVRKEMVEGQQPVDVRTAEMALKKHDQAKRTIFTIPIDAIEAEGKRIIQRISHPRCGQPNPDLLSTRPHVHNLIDSLRLRKGDVFKIWDTRTIELGSMYQQKLFEQDADQMTEHVRSYSNKVGRAIGHVGGCENDVNILTQEFEQLRISIQSSEVSVIQILNKAQQLSESGQSNHNVDVAANRLEKEWHVLQDLTHRRSSILSKARSFFISSQKYFAELPHWTSQPGVNPDDVKHKPSDVIEDAIKRHEYFNAQVEEIYAHAFDDGSKMTKALKEADAEDNVAREHLNRLIRAHKGLHDRWKDRKVTLHHMLAMIAFETDVKLVVDWLNQHGEPYLRKNVKIGDNESEAKTYQRNHQNFQKVAGNTYDNVKKLYQVYKNVTNSGSKMGDIEKLKVLIDDLEIRIERFTAKVDTRGKLLRLSVLFHTHYIELTTWFGEMRKKFDERIIESTVDLCEMAKEQWVRESDETAGAYAITIGEGKQLIQELQNAYQTCDFNYTEAIAHIHHLIADIDEKNSLLSNGWTPRRILLQIGLRFAMFTQNNWTVLSDIRNWQEDMKEMVESDTFINKAEDVLPFHRDNQAQVRAAISNIRKNAKELTQALHSHEIPDLCTREGHRVIDVIRDNINSLDKAEREVMRYADETLVRMQNACEVANCRLLANDMIAVIEKEENKLKTLVDIPSTHKEAEAGLEILKHFRDSIEKRLKEPFQMFVDKYRDYLETPHSERDIIVTFNERIQSKRRRLLALCEELGKLLNSAISFYKSYEEAVIPILSQLEKEYGDDKDKDWCQFCHESMSAQKKIEYIQELLRSHMDYKERLKKGCVYSQKSGEIFLRYVQRANKRPQDVARHQNKIRRMQEELREKQSRILELWMSKKCQLERCNSYLILDASSQQVIEWMIGEGEMKLREYEKRGKNNGNTDQDNFGLFKLQVKEQKTKIQTFLMVTDDVVEKEGNQHHAQRIKDSINNVKIAYEKFSKRVTDCEVVIRGGGELNTKNEFSLDRHSDTTILNGRVVNERKEENRRMLERMHELIKTEKDYVEDLSRCVKIYVHDFDTAVENGSIVPSLRNSKNDIFGNIEKIYRFHHEKLLPELEKYENQPEAVGSSFTVWIDLLKELYTEYCVNKEQKNHVITTPEAVEFFDGIRERHGLEVDSTIGSMLIKPVQRMTRYTLLMDQLIKSSNGNTDELREAYEVVICIPKRVNDIMNYNCLDMKDFNVDELGPFVMQATLTVWEPRAYFKGRGKERQVFLFEFSIVLAKRIETSPKVFRFQIKGKPLPMSEVSVVEHVEGDGCRFGLRVGTVASNENRTDLRAPSESVKVAWVKKIRELTAGLLPMSLGVTSGLSIPSTTSGARSVSIRSGASTSSGDRLSQDVESLMHHRHSVQSCDSEQSSEVWIVVSDFDGQAEGHLKVQKGDRVEIVEDQATDCADFIQVVLCENPLKHGLVPTSILATPESVSVPDRPDDATGSAVSKRKSLRRIFANSSKERAATASSSSNNSPATKQSTSTSSTNIHPSNGHTAEAASSSLGVLSTGETSTTNVSSTQNSVPSASTTTVTIVEEEKTEDCLPPPMQNITLNNTTMEDKETVDAPCDSNADTAPVEEVATEKVEKTPEETARFKRHYVLMELVETEQDYVRDLTSVVEGYIGNLKNMDLPEDLVGKDKIIFANIGGILEFHKNHFLADIEKCLNNYEAAGAAFVKYERRLHSLYVNYCQNKPKSDYLVSQDDFEAFFAETKAKLGQRVALCDLLIKPVQRIMKYQLLLKDILKFTERAKDRTDVLKKALQVMHVVPKACDDMMQVGRLQNFDGNLNAQGKLIYQGTLQISESMAGNTQKPKDRRIFLFEQSAIIADHIPPKKEYGNPLYIFKSQIMVNKMVFEPNVSDDPLRFVIKSSDPAQPTSFIANAQTEEEKNEWNRKIGEQLDQQKRLLAALVDPKRYMGGSDDLSSGMSNMNVGSSDKKATASSASKSCAATSKKPAESPKKESKSKSLFSFVKKPAKSPTSPPPVGNSK